MVYTSKNNNENTTKYIYYYLYANISILEKGFVGANHKNISHEYLQNIKIPIPSLDKQKEIVEYCEYNDTLIKQLEKEIENNKKLAQQFITGIVKNSTEFKLESETVQLVEEQEQKDTSSVIIEPFEFHQNEIISVENDEVVIELKPKVKKIVKKVKEIEI